MNPSSGPIIRLDNVTREYKVGTASIVHALNGVSFEITQGEFVAITGHSGSGKSTLLNLIGLLDEPSSGHLFFFNEDLASFDEKRRTEYRLRYLSFVFQFFNLIDNYTVAENISFQLELQGYPSNDARSKALEILGFLNLTHRADLSPQELSGGEQQRVAIGRALAKDSYILLADEPTAHLDSKNAAATINLLREANRAYNRTIILVTHEPEQAAQADRQIVLQDGKVIDIRKNPSTT